MLDIPSLWQGSAVLLLACSVIACLLHHNIWRWLLAAATLMGLVVGQVTPVGVGVLLVGFALAYLLRQKTLPQSALLGCGALFIAWLLAMAMHLLPGFNNIQAVNDLVVKPGSIPFSMYLNFDKPAAALLLVYAFPDCLKSNSALPRYWIGVTIAIMAAVFCLALSIGIVEFQPAFYSWFLLFIVNNFLFTCFSEEALFRGFVINRLSPRLGVWAALIISSLLFALVHLPGGVVYTVLAGVLGFAYGLAFLAGGRLYIAMLVHLGFNLIHLIFFSYPLLA